MILVTIPELNNQQNKGSYEIFYVYCLSSSIEEVIYLYEYNQNIKYKNDI